MITSKVFHTTVAILKPLWTECNERALGIRTEPSYGSVDRTQPSWWRGEPAEPTRHRDNFRYATIDYWNVRRLLRLLNPGPADVFVDIGSGMGRVVCVAARRPIARCIGVELSSSLCDVARRNAVTLRRRRAPIEIVCADAATADLSAGTMFSLFNPFGPDTLRDTVSNIERSIAAAPRRVRILYYNAAYAFVLDSVGWLEMVFETRSPGGLPIGIWQSRSAPDVVPARATPATSAQRLQP